MDNQLQDLWNQRMAQARAELEAQLARFKVELMEWSLLLWFAAFAIALVLLLVGSAATR